MQALDAKQAELDEMSARCSELRALADRRIDPEEAQAATKALEKRIEMLRLLVDAQDEAETKGGRPSLCSASELVHVHYSLYIERCSLHEL